MGRPAPAAFVHYDGCHLLSQRDMHHLVDFYRFLHFKDARSQIQKCGAHNLVLGFLHDDCGVTVCVPFHASEP